MTVSRVIIQARMRNDIMALPWRENALVYRRMNNRIPENVYIKKQPTDICAEVKHTEGGKTDIELCWKDE